MTQQLTEVVEAVAEAGGTVRPLTRDEVAQRWVTLCAAFDVDGTGPGQPWLWNAVPEQARRHVPDSRQTMALMASLVGARPALLFFEDFLGPVWECSERPGHEGLSGVALSGGGVLAAVGETTGEVCVTDPDCRWAIMLTHHDGLVGIGEAQTWVNALPSDVGAPTVQER